MKLVSIVYLLTKQNFKFPPLAPKATIFWAGGGREAAFVLGKYFSTLWPSTLPAAAHKTAGPKRLLNIQKRQ